MAKTFSADEVSAPELQSCHRAVHELLTRNDDDWKSLRFAGYEDDGAIELRNCYCGATLARPTACDHDGESYEQCPGCGIALSPPVEVVERVPDELKVDGYGPGWVSL